MKIETLTLGHELMGMWKTYERLSNRELVCVGYKTNMESNFVRIPFEMCVDHYRMLLSEQAAQIKEMFNRLVDETYPQILNETIEYLIARELPIPETLIELAKQVGGEVYSKLEQLNDEDIDADGDVVATPVKKKVAPKKDINHNRCPFGHDFGDDWDDEPECAKCKIKFPNIFKDCEEE